jgi:hypothetical protein
MPFNLTFLVEILNAIITLFQQFDLILRIFGIGGTF